MIYFFSPWIGKIVNQYYVRLSIQELFNLAAPDSVGARFGMVGAAEGLEILKMK